VHWTQHDTALYTVFAGIIKPIAKTKKTHRNKTKQSYKNRTAWTTLVYINDAHPVSVIHIITFTPDAITNGSMVSVAADNSASTFIDIDNGRRKRDVSLSKWSTDLNYATLRDDTCGTAYMSVMRKIWTLACLLVAASIFQAASASSAASAKLTNSTNDDERLTTGATTTTTPFDSAWFSVGRGSFCNQTVSYTLKTDCQPCPMNAHFGCPDGLTQVTQVFFSKIQFISIWQP